MSLKLKGKDYLDTTTKIVVADYAQKDPPDLLEKIQLVLKTCNQFSKANISFVLRHYEYDVNATIIRLQEDGAADLLSDWSVPKKNSANKKKKNKNKKKDTSENVDSSDANYPDLDYSNIPPKPNTAPLSTTANNNSTHYDTSTPLTDNIQAQNVDTHPNMNSSTVSLNSHITSNHVNTYSNGITDNIPLNTIHTDVSPPTLPSGNNLQVLLIHLNSHQRMLNQWQDMLQNRITTSFEILDCVFDQAQANLAERRHLLETTIESGRSQAVNIFEARKKLAQDLQVLAKTSPSPENTERIKQFLAEQATDKLLGESYTLELEGDTLIEAVSNMGSLTNCIPQYTYWSLSSTNVASPGQAQKKSDKRKSNKRNPPPENSVQTAVPASPPNIQESYITTNNTATTPSNGSQTNNHNIMTDSIPSTASLLSTASLPSTASLQQSNINQVDRESEKTPTFVFEDPYALAAKPSKPISSTNTTQEEKEAAKLRIQKLVNSQNRNMIVSDTDGNSHGFGDDDNSRRNDYNGDRTTRGERKDYNNRNNSRRGNNDRRDSNDRNVRRSDNDRDFNDQNDRRGDRRDNNNFSDRSDRRVDNNNNFQENRNERKEKNSREKGGNKNREKHGPPAREIYSDNSSTRLESIEFNNSNLDENSTTDMWDETCPVPTMDITNRSYNDDYMTGGNDYTSTAIYSQKFTQNDTIKSENITDNHQHQEETLPTANTSNHIKNNEPINCENGYDNGWNSTGDEW